MAAESPEQHTSAVEEDAEAGHAENSDEEDAEPDGSESNSEGHGDSQDSTSKKKKKKKKKKKGGGGGGSNSAAQPAVDPAARKEGERRLQEALDLLSHNSEDGMWVKLSGCHLADGKLKKLCEALKSNTACISLDLSDNLLTDQGARALAAALADGRAPDLIDLDLRDNPQIQRDGTAALEELQGKRKTLRVALGPSTPPAADQPAPADQQPRSPKAGGADAQQQQQQRGHANGGGSLADSVKSNPVISKYFAVGNDEAEEAEQAAAAGQEGGAEGEQLGGLSAAELARILWDQLEEALDAPRPDIPAVSEPLRALAEQVEHEMDGCALPMLPSTEVGELKTFTLWALRKLHLLHSVLDLEPPPILTPYSKMVPVPAVGTHRAAVAELLAQLLRGACTAIARPVAASGLLPRCAALALRHPNCSPLHGAVARCLRLSLSKPLGPVRLWQQLLAPHPARAAAGAASAAAAASLDLAAEVAGIAEAAAAAPTVGKRPPNMGFALAVAQALHAAATGEALGAGSRAEGQAGGGEQQEGQQAPDAAPASEGTARPEADAEGAWEAQLAAHLAKADAWVHFADGPASLMRRLLAEHEGDLGGPRPRPSASPPPVEDDGAGQGQVISGQELLMMLRGLNLGGGFSGM